ncbi:hypothetical protein HCN44_007094 [Aphidius gifuensis]|uniref:Uncharacterized protein n=1 Tax=Aphidius gifuensis TaxID=684658 RepID=A0A835CLG7_APHGI|nr:hypothetical protein HCN44_007094 [Aphidius gifuensis]
MHSLYLGVIKQLVHLWFLREHQNSAWSLHSKLNQVDEMICVITAPRAITPRLPRTISQSLAQWKAHEYKTWFFYYSLPILKQINMPDNYLSHYQLLVNAICMLNQPSISDETINFADTLLNKFVKDFEGLYSRNSLSANLHLLLHMADNTRDFAQPYITSCFSFENINGQLNALVSGTRFSGLQISTGLSYFMSIPGLLKNLGPDSIILNFCQHITQRTKMKKYETHKISKDTYIVGSINKRVVISRVVANKLRSTFNGVPNIKLFHRLLKSEIIYTSATYERITKTNSSWVKYQLGNQTIDMV